MVYVASFPGLPHLQFLHTVSDQKLEVWKDGNEARFTYETAA